MAQPVSPKIPNAESPQLPAAKKSRFEKIELYALRNEKTGFINTLKKIAMIIPKILGNVALFTWNNTARHLFNGIHKLGSGVHHLFSRKATVQKNPDNSKIIKLPASKTDAVGRQEPTKEAETVQPAATTVQPEAPTVPEISVSIVPEQSVVGNTKTTTACCTDTTKAES
ncbi:MAG: hypothetical protein HW387_929 [Parachlamydiales bacterium]|nr:hypothetical protein [Parachlamydiales bacterium]